MNQTEYATHAERYDAAAREYDAILVVSFGGPEGPDDVMPFLDNVFGGLSVSPATRTQIADRYQVYGGVSPINAENRRLIAALGKDLEAHGVTLPIYWGNRNWQPYLGDTLTEMERDGIRRACVYITSLFSSYSGCRKYREDLYAACAPLARPPQLDRVRLGFNHPGFVAAMAERVAAALAQLPDTARADAPIIFTAHSLPESQARQSDYQLQLDAACRLVADHLHHDHWRLVYQSNNARYGGDPWLEPDISEALTEMHAAGTTHAVVAPIGFVCDHMEVIQDLDVVAAEAAQSIGLTMVRAETVGTHPAFVGMVRELILERMTANPERRALGTLGPHHDWCPPDCCLSGRPGAAKPSLCGLESA